MSMRLERGRDESARNLLPLSSHTSNPVSADSSESPTIAHDPRSWLCADLHPEDRRLVSPSDEPFEAHGEDASGCGVRGLFRSRSGFEILGDCRSRDRFTLLVSVVRWEADPLCAHRIRVARAARSGVAGGIDGVTVTAAVPSSRGDDGPLRCRSLRGRGPARLAEGRESNHRRRASRRPRQRRSQILLADGGGLHQSQGLQRRKREPRWRSVTTSLGMHRQIQPGEDRLRLRLHPRLARNQGLQRGRVRRGDKPTVSPTSSRSRASLRIMPRWTSMLSTRPDEIVPARRGLLCDVALDGAFVLRHECGAANG